MGGDGQCLLVWSTGCSVSTARRQVSPFFFSFTNRPVCSQRTSYLWTEETLLCLISCSYFLLFPRLSFSFSSTDETATENILKAELTMASLCGRLGLVTPRDAFITAICKASLPPHYALTVLSSNAANLSSKGSKCPDDPAALLILLTHSSRMQPMNAL